MDSENQDYRLRKLISAINNSSNAALSDKDFTVAPTNLNTEPMVRYLGDTFQKNIVVFDSHTDKLSINGAIDPGQPNTIFINSNSPNMIATTFGHELLHHIRIDEPELYHDFANAMSELIQSFEPYQKWIKEQSLEGMSLDNSEIQEEFLADFLGSQFGNQWFWKSFADSKIDTCSKTVGHARELYHARMDATPTGHLESHVINQISDLRAAIDAAQRLVNAYLFNKQEANRIYSSNHILGGFKENLKPRFMYAGQKASKAPTDDLYKASQMYRDGANEDDIWLKTGWLKGKDGKYRFEITDSESFFFEREDLIDELIHLKKSMTELFKDHERGLVDDDTVLSEIKMAKTKIDRLNMAITQSNNYEPDQLGHCFFHPILFANYPSLGDAKIILVDNPEIMPIQRLGGTRYNPNTGNCTFTFNLYAFERMKGDFITNITECITHELQHGIQYIEDFSSGGEPEEMEALASKILHAEADLKMNELLQRWLDAPPFVKDALHEQYLKAKDHFVNEGWKEQVKEKAHELYEQLYGELEAEDSAKRINLQPHERRAILPMSNLGENITPIIRNSQNVFTTIAPTQTKDEEQISASAKDSLSSEKEKISLSIQRRHAEDRERMLLHRLDDEALVNKIERQASNYSVLNDGWSASRSVDNKKWRYFKRLEPELFSHSANSQFKNFGLSGEIQCSLGELLGDKTDFHNLPSSTSIKVERVRDVTEPFKIGQGSLKIQVDTSDPKRVLNCMSNAVSSLVTLNNDPLQPDTLQEGLDIPEKFQKLFSTISDIIEKEERHTEKRVSAQPRSISDVSTKRRFP